MPKKERKSKRDGLFLRGKIWWFRRMDNGQRRAVTTGCRESDRRAAERRAIEIEKDWNDGKFGWKPEPVAVVPTIEEYVKTSYEAHYKHQLTALRILEKHTQLIAAFPRKRLNEFSQTDCQGFLNGLGVAQNSVRAMHIACKSLFERAVSDKHIEDNPWAFLMVGDVPRARVMSIEEQVRLFPTLPDSARRAATVAVWSGLRNHELCWIERGDVDWLRRVIRVRAEITKGKKGKKKARMVPMTDECAAAIREQIADFDQGDLARRFPKYRDGEPRIFPYAPTSLAGVFRRAVEALRIPQLTIHDLRRTFGTRMAEKASIRRVQKFMGHSKVETTAKFYTHVDEYDMRDVDAASAIQREALAKATPATVLSIKKAVNE